MSFWFCVLRKGLSSAYLPTGDHSGPGGGAEPEITAHIIPRMPDHPHPPNPTLRCAGSKALARAGPCPFLNRPYLPADAWGGWARAPWGGEASPGPGLWGGTERRDVAAEATFLPGANGRGNECRRARRVIHPRVEGVFVIGFCRLWGWAGLGGYVLPAETVRAPIRVIRCPGEGGTPPNPQTSKPTSPRSRMGDLASANS